MVFSESVFLPAILAAGVQEAKRTHERTCNFVMPGLVPGIHVLITASSTKTWMAGHMGVYARLRRAMPGHDSEFVGTCHPKY